MKLKTRVMVEVNLPFEADVPELDLQEVEGHTSQVGANEEAVLAARVQASRQAEALAAEAFAGFDVVSLVVQEVSPA